MHLHFVEPPFLTFPPCLHLSLCSLCHPYTIPPSCPPPPHSYSLSFNTEHGDPCEGFVWRKEKLQWQRGSVKAEHFTPRHTRSICSSVAPGPPDPPPHSSLSPHC